MRGTRRRPQGIAQPGRHRAHADGDGFEMTAARPPGQDRPWARASTRRTRQPSSRRHGRSRAMRRRGRGSGGGRLSRLSTAGTARPACPGCARASAAGCAPRRTVLAGSSAIEAPRRRKRLSVASSSSISATTMSPVSAASVLLDQHRVAVEDAGLDHRIAAHLEREMLAGAEHVGRHVDGVAAWSGSPRSACRRRCGP